MRSTFLINEIHKKHLLNFISNIFCNLARAYSWWGEVRVQSVKLQKLATASFKSWLPSSMLWATQVLLSEILDKIKLNSKPPYSPNQGWSRAKGKNAPFSHPWFGGGGGEGGLGFPFILSKIVGEISDLAQFSVKCFSVEVITVNDKNTGFLSDI